MYVVDLLAPEWFGRDALCMHRWLPEPVPPVVSCVKGEYGHEGGWCMFATVVQKLTGRELAQAHESAFQPTAVEFLVE